ncbi:hypothetical protein [Sandaracinus amylolyticus]|nr:hypothetical protein [Sandaracinus amylolyticus]
MRRAAVIGLFVLALAGCDDGPRSATSSASSEDTSGGERLERARREMGLREVAEEDEDDGELPFALGPERLPELPREVDAEEAPLAPGLARAIDALMLARPEPEADLDRAGYQTFVEEDYARWVAARADALRVARTALAPAEQGEVGEYVVASAVIGLMLARFADAIATMPVPSTIDLVPADRLRFRDAYLRAAAPLWDRAADAFGACASASARADDATLSPWQRFCDERLEQAQDAPRPVE